ncbi:MAG: glycosyltransferase family 2 protein [Candidatus Omnitrophica bacterium]|nr:glycosyltransferase family 2 protein [Candidatus Omnitrophota bacterium]
MKVCVIIPTYNEAKSIGNLVKRIQKMHLKVVVIDDGSKDNTGKIARENGAEVLRNETNQGKGASLIKGFDYALKNNFDAVICMDGDGQHLPEEIPIFINLATHSDSHILIGNRMAKRRNMPLLRVFTNKFMSWLISCITKQRIPDSQCGFRLIKRIILEKLKLTTHKYETESEIIIKASRLGFKIDSVPIKTIYTGGKSQINPLIDTLRFIRYIVKEIWITPS